MSNENRIHGHNKNDSTIKNNRPYKTKDCATRTNLKKRARMNFKVP